MHGASSQRSLRNILPVCLPGWIVTLYILFRGIYYTWPGSFVDHQGRRPTESSWHCTSRVAIGRNTHRVVRTWIWTFAYVSMMKAFCLFNLDKKWINIMPQIYRTGHIWFETLNILLFLRHFRLLYVDLANICIRSESVQFFLGPLVGSRTCVPYQAKGSTKH